MNGKNRKSLFSTLIILLLCLSLVLSFAACNDEPEENPEEEALPTIPAATITELTTNGSFYTATGDTYPKTPGTWTGAVGYSSGTTATPAEVGTDLVYGVVSLQADYYNKYKSTWGSLDNPGLQVVGDKTVSAENDYHVLMINNKVATAYSYSNAATTLAASNFYRINVSVLTTALEGDEKKGAYISIVSSSTTLAKWEAVSTDGQWAVYSLYVESKPSVTEKLTIKLGLGSGATDSGCMTKGYAFFDNIDAISITKAEYEAATESATASKVSRVFLDPAIEASTSSITQPYTPSYYTSKAGSTVANTDGDNAKITSDYAKHGLVNATDSGYLTGLISQLTEQDLASIATASANGDDRVLMIYNKSYTLSTTKKDESGASYEETTIDYSNGTATGYASNSFRVPIGKTVKLSISVWTKILNTDAATNGRRGVTLMLNGATSLNSTIKPTEGAYTDWTAINTNGAWATYTFYVKGNAYVDYDYTLEMWLGQGNANEKDWHTYGVAMFDNIQFEILEDESEYTAATQAVADNNATAIKGYHMIPGAEMCATITVDAADNSIVNGSFADSSEDNGWDFSVAGDIYAEEGVDYNAGIITAAQSTSADALAAYGISAEKAPTVGVPNSAVENLYAIGLLKPTAVTMKLDQALAVKKNVCYRFSMWIKTVDIPTSTGVTISLTSAEGTSLASFSAVNTDSYINYYTNNYRHYIAYIEGGDSKDTTANLSLSLGAGSNVDPSGYTTGAAFIGYVSMNAISYDDYAAGKKAALSYTTSTSLSTSSSTVSNGTFSLFNKETSNYNETTGELETVPGVPSNWALEGNTDVDNITSGIVNINDAILMNNLGLNAADVYNKWYAANADGSLPVSNAICGDGAPNLLLIRADQAGIVPNGYTITQSLTKNTNYIFYFDVKTIGTAKASIYATSTTTGVGSVRITDINTSKNGEDTWARFAIGIENGNSATSLDITLYLGGESTVPESSDASTYISAGDTVLFDSVRYVSYTTTADYTEACDKLNAENYAADAALNAQDKILCTTSFTVESFDSNSGITASVSPFAKAYTSNFTGTAVSDTDASTGINYQVMGILNRTDVTAEKLDATGLYESVEEDGATVRKKAAGSSLTMAEVANIFDTTVTPLGDNVLFINNLEKSGYSYVTSSSVSMATGSYYAVSIWVLTHKIAAGSGAFLRLKAGDNTHTYSGINTSAEDGTMGEWTKYTFYISNTLTTATVSTTSLSLTLTMGLGQTGKDNYVQGYAFFDNMEIKSITKEAYEKYATAIPATEAAADGTFAKRQGVDRVDVADASSAAIGTAWVLNYADGEGAKDADKDDPSDDDDDATEQTEQKGDFPWEYVTMIAIAVALIAAVIAVLIRKYGPRQKPGVSGPTDKAYSRNYTAAVTKADKRKEEYSKYADNNTKPKKKK